MTPGWIVCRDLRIRVRPLSSLIKQRLAAGKIVRAMHVVGYATPRVIELVGRLGNLHGIWFDQEHAAISHAELELMLIACRATGLDAFARVPPTDYATIMRPMEAGCGGVMIAQVRKLDEVHQAIDWAKYPPVGHRGLSTANVETVFGTIDIATHVVNANCERWLAVQIETPEALEVVDQIAALPEVDWLFVGPVDLSVTLGVPGDFMHPKCVAALEHVAAATKKVDKAWGILARDEKHASLCKALGCQFFSIFGDVDCLRVGLESLEQRFSNVLGI